MQKRLLFTSFCILISISALADRIDSIGVENNNGKQVILHKVEAKENYYSLGRKYNVPPKDIINYNNNQPLNIGSILKIPTNRPFAAQSHLVVNKTVALTDNSLVEYKVGAKESLYAIARRFNTTVEEIKQLNNLTSNALRIGQILKIKPVGTTAVNIPESAQPKQVVQATNPDPVTEPDTSNAAARVKANKFGLREIHDNGVAIWIADENLDGAKMLALHRTAPVGTIIKITNPMTDRSTFAKVVGKFTENETTKDVIIVVTKATADLLGALDKRFQVSLVYGVPNE